MSAKESPPPRAGGEGAASEKVEAWRSYFRDRGLSPADIPKALVVHEVRR